MSSPSGGRKLLTLWEVATGKEVRSLPGHTDWVTGVAFVTKGKQALSASRDGWLMLHDGATGNLLRRRRAYESNINALAAPADGKAGW